jgi:hypothetical protein
LGVAPVPIELNRCGWYGKASRDSERDEIVRVVIIEKL